MENLGGSPTLEQMAAVVHLSPFHFARQFKAATGLAPHQYVIARRVERAQHLLRTDGRLGLAEVAFRSGFAKQSHCCVTYKAECDAPPFWAFFAFSLSGSSASRRDSFRLPQESPKRTQLRRELGSPGPASLLLERDAYQGNRVTSISFSIHVVNFPRSYRLRTSGNIFYAFRLDGMFKRVRTRIKPLLARTSSSFSNCTSDRRELTDV
jgi:AraC-like DNA-binding protein